MTQLESKSWTGGLKLYAYKYIVYRYILYKLIIIHNVKNLKKSPTKSTPNCVTDTEYKYTLYIVLIIFIVIKTYNNALNYKTCAFI